MLVSGRVALGELGVFARNTPGNEHILDPSQSEDMDVILGDVFSPAGNTPLSLHQWLFLVPIKGGRDYITPRFGKDYKWYISGIFPANWGMDYATYLPPFTFEPEKSIDYKLLKKLPNSWVEKPTCTARTSTKFAAKK